jgi:hypothetical protein
VACVVEKRSVPPTPTPMRFASPAVASRAS